MSKDELIKTCSNCGHGKKQVIACSEHSAYCPHNFLGCPYPMPDAVCEKWVKPPVRDYAHLEGTEWHTVTPEGFPDAVVFAKDGSVFDGSYETRRYIPEERYKELYQIAQDLCSRIGEQAATGQQFTIETYHKFYDILEGLQ